MCVRRDLHGDLGEMQIHRLGVAKNARIAWSLLTSDSVYDVRLSVRQPESKILRERAPPTIAIEERKMAKRVTSVTSRTWCLDRHGFGQCLGVVEVEAREN